MPGKKQYFNIFIVIVSSFLLTGVQKLYAQNEFSYFMQKAIDNNSEMKGLLAGRQYYELEKQIIETSGKTPQVYLSSDFLFAPYLNNNGQIISATPSINAIGYDAGITNGGLYSILLNADYQVFNRNIVKNQLVASQIEIFRINNSIQKLEADIRFQIGSAYLDVLSALAEWKLAEKKTELLVQQVALVKQLSQHGYFSYADFLLLNNSLKEDSISLQKTELAYSQSLALLRTSCGLSDTIEVELEPYEPELSSKSDTSLFLGTYRNDSLSSEIQKKIIGDQYRPQVKVFANSGFNSTPDPVIGRHFGLSAGFQLTYPIFDGGLKNKKIAQQVVLGEQARQQIGLKSTERDMRISTLKYSLFSMKNTLLSEEKLLKNYEDILHLYQEEMQKGNMSLIDFLNFVQMYNQSKLNLEMDRIAYYKLINELNYWNN